MGLEKLLIINKLGEGGYGQVYKAKLKETLSGIGEKDQVVAVKVIPKRLETSIRVEIDVNMFNFSIIKKLFLKLFLTKLKLSKLFLITFIINLKLSKLS